VSDTPTLLLLQGDPAIPDVNGVSTGTDLIVSPATIQARLAHFSEHVYRMEPESALVRFASVLLGDAGIGQLRKKYILRRLQQTLQGTHFFDLDRFYGALFGVQRRAAEIISIDPYAETATAEEWEAIHSRDASYRSRISQFSKALSYGPTPVGMELIAEALLSVDVDIYESYRDVDDGVAGVTNRRMFTVRPKRAITPEEHYDVIRVLSRIKPVDAFAVVDAAGVAAHTPLVLRGVASDSEHWEIISKVQPRQVTTVLPYPIIDVEAMEQPRVPFGGYQGEAWNYNGDVSGVLAYYRFENIDKNTPVQEEVFDQTGSGRGPEKLYVSYPPEGALSSQRDIIAGRYISDAVYQAHPYGDRHLGRTDVYVTDDGQVFALLDTGQAVKLGINYVDSIPIPGLLEALRQLPATSFDPGATGNQHFWVTPKRPLENQFREILEVRLNVPRYINYIGARSAHYPHYIDIEVYDEATATWNKVFGSRTSDSIPSRPPTTPEGTEHPFHPDSTGAWVKQSASFEPVRASRIRVVMWRDFTGTPPQKVVTFSFGGFSIGIPSPSTTVSFGSSGELYSFRDSLFVNTPATWYSSTQGPAGISITYNVPSVQQVSVGGGSSSYSEPLAYSLALRDLEIGYRVNSYKDVPLNPASTTDLLGSLVQFELRENPASNAIDDDVPSVWRSEPQPSGSAVVNYFADTRDAAGDAQTIDRFFLDPLYPGPHVSVYYSNDDIPAGDIRADNDPLNFPIVSPTGAISFDVGAGAASFDLDDPAYIDISNQAVQFDPRLPFHIHAVLRPHFAYNVGHHVFFDFGGFKLEQQSGSIHFKHPDGTDAHVAPAFPADAILRVIATNDVDTISLWVSWGDHHYSSLLNVVTTPSTSQPPNLRIGGPLSGSADDPAFDLLMLMASRGDVPASDISLDPSTFLVGGDYTSKVTRLVEPNLNDPTNNSILRFSTSLLSATNDYGFVGGPGEFYDFLSWTPIARDFTVQKGFLHLPPTKGRFWKFEFTNLVAEPYDSFVPINRIVKTFGDGVSRESMWQTINSDPESGPPGMRAAIDLGDRLFIDNFIQVSESPDGLSPTEVRYITNVWQAETVRQQNLGFGYKPWHLGIDAPSFQREGVHEYEQVEVRHSDKLAFFCGLKGFGAYRVDYTVDDDTTVYYERFHDPLHLVPGYTWNLDPNHLYNDGNDNAAAHSVTFESAHDLVGLQFATHQSHPVQIVYDHDLKDPALASSDFTDTDQWSKVGDARITYVSNTNSLLIERSGMNDLDGEAAGADISLVVPLIQPVFRRDYITAAEVAAAASSFGGVDTPPAISSDLGMLHAAVRFTSIDDTTSIPYFLQIITTAGVALVERALPARAGQVIEDYISYEIGSIAAPGTAVRARLIQKSKVASSISLDTMSIFDDGIVWDFSADGGATWVLARGGVRNNPFGVVTFATPGNELVWRARASRPDMHITSLQIRPIYAGLRAYRPSGIMHGPNLSTYDQEPPVDQDPEFQSWHKPVPFWWWRESRRFPNLPVEGLPASSEFARFYGRPSEDTVAAPTDVVSRMKLSFRGTADSAPATDGAVRGSLFIRTATDSAPVTDAAVGINIPTGSALIQTPPHLPINDDI
jgi:hypothetical protein